MIAVDLERAVEILEHELEISRIMTNGWKSRGISISTEMMQEELKSDALETVLNEIEGNRKVIERITILGCPVTKKNSMQIIKLKNGKQMIKPSEKFEEYQEVAWRFMPKGKKPINTHVNVKCVYYMPTRRRVDLVNLLEATDDILVHYHVLEDDNSEIIASHNGSRVLYDKERPRVEIEITDAVL